MSFYGTANVSGMVSEERVRDYVNGNPLVEKWKAKRVKQWCDQRIKESDSDRRKKFLKYLYEEMVEYCADGLDDSMIDPSTELPYNEILELWRMKESAFVEGWNCHCDAHSTLKV